MMGPWVQLKCCGGIIILTSLIMPKIKGLVENIFSFPMIIIFSYNNFMKQLEHIYIDLDTLKKFIKNNDLTHSCLVQIYSNNKTHALSLTSEVEQAMGKDTKINTLVSESLSETIINFTKLLPDTQIINQDPAQEFEFFQTGPVVIFKREPKNDCWVLSFVTNSVSQWGYDPASLLDDADAIRNIFHIEDLAKIRKTIMESITSGQDNFNHQYRIYRADGTVVWVSDYTKIVRNSKAEPIQLIGYLVDITQDKRHEALYEGIINTTTEGFWLLDSELKIIDVNYSLCTMLGYTKTEILGREPLEFISSQDLDLCKSQADRICDISSRIYEISYRRKDGKLLHTLTNATTMYDKDGEMKTFAFMTDISNQKKIEEDLRKRQDNIEELNNSLESKIRYEVEKNREKDQMMYQQSRLASMGEMIGNIAHQWRQPLNIMALVMQDLYISDQLGSLTSKKVEDSYEKSNNLLQYMSHTIDDFRNFFKQGDEDLEFSAKEAIDSVYNLISTNLSYNHIACTIDVKQDSIVRGGLNEFKQVLINILNNAQEAIQSHASKEKKINITITRKNNNALIMISDDGGGIKKDVINKIFDPYFTTKNQTQGTGLGLYMSKQIIENSMCGSLSAKNTDIGAEFSILLPVKTAE